MAEELAGWRSYFEDISRFLEGAERQYGIANDNFTDVLERLELCIRTCTILSDHLVSETVPELDEGELAIVGEYQSTILELLQCMRSLHQKWTQNKGIIDATAPNLAYQDQLEYLASLSFSWNEIASLFGVSRMTIYKYPYTN